MNRFMGQRTAMRAVMAGLGASAVLGAMAALGVDPKFDRKVLVFCTTQPKAGQKLWANFVNEARQSYENIFDDYWRQSSYFKYDPVTGNKLQGWNVTSKAYGGIYMPWTGAPRDPAAAGSERLPFASFGYGVTEPRGCGESFDETESLYYPKMNADGTPYVPEDLYNNPLADGFWTPGESFQIIGTNDARWIAYGPSNPPVAEVFGDDWWRSSNTDRFRTDSCGNTLPANLQRTAPGWDSKRGEIYADYNNNVDLANGVVGYDYATPILLADANPSNRVNQALVVNELELDPKCLGALSGDFYHTVVYGDPTVTNNVDVPLNSVLDYAVDRSGQPMIYPANIVTPTSTNQAYITYLQWQVNGIPWLGTNQAPDNAVLATNKVFLYQSAELFITNLLTAADGNIYGDPNAQKSAPAAYVPPQPGTPGTKSSPFEDFISWWDPTGPDKDGNPLGGYTYVPVAELAKAPWFDPNPSINRTNRGDRTVQLTWEQYTNYIAWNYPGDADTLIRRAGNGWYDGPDKWKASGYTTKYIQHGVILASEAITPAPTNTSWDERFMGTWENWWKAAFGVSNAPPWGAPDFLSASWLSNAIPSVTPLTVVVGAPGTISNETTHATESWMPASDWGYNGPRNFCDMASSLYHLGVPETATNIWAPDTPDSGEHWGMVRADAKMSGRPAGDGSLGEVTSPWSDNVYGQDIGSGPGSTDKDQLLTAGGPFAFNVAGINGYDAGNVLMLECLTHQYMPPTNAATVYMDTNRFRFYRDCNLDGLLNLGESRTAEANYGKSYTPGNFAAGLEVNYPFNIFRYLEDTIACWDNGEDFTTLFTNKNPAVSEASVLWAAVLYPTATNAGNTAFGQTSGRQEGVLTLDRLEPINIEFQVRSPGAGGGAEGPVDTNAVGSDYCMNINAHECGHDWFGWPDLYDYDVWNGKDAQLQYPVGIFDLMSGGGMVHGVPTLKAGNGWVTPINLTSLLTLNGGPVTLKMKPVNVNSNAYYYYDNPLRPGERFYFYFIDGTTGYTTAGSPGLLIMHEDLGGYAPNALPQQQRQDTHFIWEMVPGDGLNHMQDGDHSGDAGIPFPGTSGRTTWTSSGFPNNRWWDQTDSGIRITNIQLPAVAGQPASVTFEYYNPSTPPVDTLDTDGDGMPDWWERVHNLNPLVDDAKLDPDADGLSNLQEFQAGTDPQMWSTANDGISDSDVDSDHDGLSNGDEQRFGTHPGLKDTDDDGYEDGAELNRFLPDPADNFGIFQTISSPLDALSPSIPRSFVLSNIGLVAPNVTNDMRFNLLFTGTNSTSNLVVTITSPASNAVSTVRFITVQGTVASSAALQSVKIYNNNALAADAGTASNFNSTIIISAGTNQISVVATDVDGLQGSAAVPVVGSFATGDIRITQTWSAAGDLDTWLVDPLGRHRGWTSSGPGLPTHVAQQIPNSVLDIDDTSGTGPENITLEHGASTNGNYEVWMNNFSNSGNPASTVRVLVNEGGAGQQYVEFGPQAMPISDGNGSNPLAWWHVTTISMPSGAMSPPGTPVAGQPSVDPTGTNDTGAVFVSTPGFTIEAWVKLGDTNQTGAIARHMLNDGRLGYVVGLATNRPYIRLGLDSGAFVEANGGALPSNTWTHLGFVYSETARSLRVYINGTLAAAKQVLLTRATGYGVLTVSTNLTTAAPFFTNAKLDELRFWSRARSGAALTAYMYQTVLQSQALVACYKFDDGGFGIADSTHPMDHLYDLGGYPLPDNWTDAKPGPDGIWGTPDDIPAGLGWDGHNDYVTCTDAAPVTPIIDSNGNNIPDWWEQLFFGTLTDASADPDGDGLNNLYEYFTGNNPLDGDTDNNGIPDGQEDYDQDGLSNIQEQQLGSRPDLKDTDDDGVSDVLDPNPQSALVPLVDRILYVNGSASSFVQTPDSARFGLTNWTIAAWVKPTALPTTSADLITRQVQSGVMNYSLKLLSNGQVRAQFTPGDLTTPVTLTAPLNKAIGVGVWSHVAATFSASAGQLMLYVNGVQVATVPTAKRPAYTGVGPALTRLGAGFSGYIEEAAVYNAALSTANIVASTNGIANNVNLTVTPVCYYRFDDGTNPDGTSGQPRWTTGQVQDFANGVAINDWMNNWRNAGTLYGAAVITNAIADNPVKYALRDSDGDGMPDAWEAAHGLNPNLNDAMLDPDGDGLLNIYEYWFGTDPQNSDTNGDGIPDGEEDSNGNGIPNYYEQQLSLNIPFRVLAGQAGSPGSADGVVGSVARFNLPAAVAVDKSNLVYVADTVNSTIRLVTEFGRVTTLAGSVGVTGSIDSIGNAALFNHPAGLATDSSNNVYVADTGNHTIRKIIPVVGSVTNNGVNPPGVVTTLAGTAGLVGTNDGTGAFARFENPTGIAVDNAGNVYVADTGNHTIRKIVGNGAVTTFAGSPGVLGSADGTNGASARFNRPTGVAVDNAGNVYVADSANHMIRKITPAGAVTTLAGRAGMAGCIDAAGAAARFNTPMSLAVDNFGMILVADSGNQIIRKITPTGSVMTMAGTAGIAGTSDGTSTPFQFNAPQGIAVKQSGIVVVADTGNQRVAIGLPAAQTAQINYLTTPPSAGVVVGAGQYPVGASIQLAASALPGWIFMGWSDGVGSATRTVTVPAGGATYTAVFAQGIGAPLDATTFVWTLGGAANWFGQNAVTHDGAAALRSGAIGHGQDTWFQTTTNGPGSILFWWKVSSEPNDYLEFYAYTATQTQAVTRISGNVNWQQYAAFLSTTNEYTFKWRYVKDGSVSSGSDAGFVDQVTWIPCPFAQNVPQLFFQNSSGLLASWVLNTTGGFEFARILANTGGWALKAAGDIDGDGVSDLLFQTPGSDTGGWFMNADGSVRDARFWWNIGGWEIKAAADYEGVGRAQVFFQNASGVVAYWRLDALGNFQSAVVLGSVGTWKLRSAGDIDGDGKADLIFQNGGGAVMIWYHNPDNSIRSVTPFATGEWALRGMTDVDADGVSDLIWQTPDLRTGGWFMNADGTFRDARFWWPTIGWQLKAAGR